MVASALCTASEGKEQVSDSLLRAKRGLDSRLAGGAGRLETSQQMEFTYHPVEAAQASKDGNCWKWHHITEKMSLRSEVHKKEWFHRSYQI